MLHLSTGIAAENKIHAATEWGSRSECNEMQWNGEANEEIHDRHGINLWVRGRCCRGRFAGPSAAAADPSSREGADRQRPDRQRPDRQGSDRQGSCGRSRTDRHQGLIRQTDGSTRLVRSGLAKREVELLRHVAATTGVCDFLRSFFA